MTELIGVIFGILVSVWAYKRGYAWWAYILASPIVAAIALGVLPNLSEPGKEFENKTRNLCSKTIYCRRNCY